MSKQCFVVLIIIIIFIFLCGFVIFLIPTMNKVISENKAEDSIEDYEIIIEKSYNDLNQESDFLQLYEDVKTYNISLFENKPAFSEEIFAQSMFDLESYGLVDNIYGYIVIDKLDIKLPIYLGATNSAMKRGVAHMGNTSIPIAQENTNAVLAGHRGYYGAHFFRYIDQLEPGDKIKIVNPWGTLIYSVIEEKIIEKDASEELNIRGGMTLLTLSTCHPFPKNTHRYLVIAELKEWQSNIIP